MIDGATISAMNLAEVVGKLTDANMDESQIRSVLADLVMSVSPFTEENAYGTGLLRRSTRALGLSLADRACLNLAEILSLPAMTTEAAWLRIQGSPQVEKIR
jgi:PIN domain nuclease of toxin-antitoxin system